MQLENKNYLKGGIGVGGLSSMCDTGRKSKRNTPNYKIQRIYRLLPHPPKKLPVYVNSYFLLLI